MSNIFFVQPNRDFRSDVLCGQSCRDAKRDKTALEFEVKDLKKKLEHTNTLLRWERETLDEEKKDHKQEMEELTKKIEEEQKQHEKAESMLSEQNILLHEQVEALSAEKAQLIERNTSLLEEINRLRSSELGNPLERDNFKGAKNWPNFPGEDGTNPT